MKIRWYKIFWEKNGLVIICEILFIRNSLRNIQNKEQLSGKNYGVLQKSSWCTVSFNKSQARARVQQLTTKRKKTKIRLQSWLEGKGRTCAWREMGDAYFVCFSVFLLLTAAEMLCFPTLNYLDSSLQGTVIQSWIPFLHARQG